MELAFAMLHKSGLNVAHLSFMCTSRADGIKIVSTICCALLGQMALRSCLQFAPVLIKRGQGMYDYGMCDYEIITSSLQFFSECTQEYSR